MDRCFPIDAPHLPSDIWFLIFGEIYNTPRSSTLWDLRFVSHQFNTLITPLVYRRIGLNDSIVRCFKSQNTRLRPVQIRVAEYISAYTREITIPQVVDVDSLAALLISLRDLRHLTLHYQSKIYQKKQSQGIIDLRWSSVHGSLQSIRLDDLLALDGLNNLPKDERNLRLLPYALLTSYKIAGCLTLSPKGSIARILVASPQLKVLHMIHCQTARSTVRPYRLPDFYFTEHDVRQGERLPAIEELSLQAYGPTQYFSIPDYFWDWSNLKSLTIQRMDILLFYHSLPSRALCGLRHLKLDGFCRIAREIGRVTRMIANRLEDIEALESLSLVCWLEKFPFDAIQRHCSTLQALDIRDYRGVRNKGLRHLQTSTISIDESVPTLSLEELTKIHMDFPLLEDISLDLNQIETVCTLISCNIFATLCLRC